MNVWTLAAQFAQDRNEFKAQRQEHDGPLVWDCYVDHFNGLYGNAGIPERTLTAALALYQHRGRHYYAQRQEAPTR